MLNEVKIIYTELLKKHEREQSISCQGILNNILEYLILSLNEKLKLEGEITKEEISSILKKMKNNVRMDSQ